MKIMKICICAIALLAAFAAPTGVSANSDKPVYLIERYYSAPQSQKVDPPVRVGDILRFRWVGEPKPPASAVDIVPAQEGKSLSDLGWEVYAHPKDDATAAFSVIPLSPGKVELPALAVRDAEKQVLGVTRPLSMDVAPAASPEELQKKAPDLLPPLAMKFPWAWVGALAVTGLVVAAILGRILWRVSRRYRRKPAPATSAPVTARISVDEEALQLLDKVEGQRLWEVQRFKPHYFGISEVVKRYAERRFGVDAAESTTREMLALLSTRGLDPSQVSALASLFEKLDRVKFTDFTPDGSEARAVMDEARSWVKSTRPAAPASGGGNAV